METFAWTLPEASEIILRNSPYEIPRQGPQALLRPSEPAASAASQSVFFNSWLVIAPLICVLALLSQIDGITLLLLAGGYKLCSMLPLNVTQAP